MTSPPFDTAHLDALLGERGLAALLASSSHSTRYLLGGYRFFLYDKLPSIGLTRYVPLLGYVTGQRDLAFYVGAGNEDWGTAASPIWPEVHNVAWGAADAAAHAAHLLRRRRLDGARIGIESAYLPAEAFLAVQSALPAAELVDAADVLEELRAVKRADELELIRRAASANVDAMLATFQAVEAGQTTAEIVERLWAEQTGLGLDFAYCLIAAGPRHDRAPSAQAVDPGDIVSLDSGTSYRGYVADCVRMGVLGEPTSRMAELLAEVDEVQQAVRAAIGAGRRGGDLFAVADEHLARTPSRDRASFLVHGTGLLTHEAPRLTATGSPPYPAAHADRPLLAGMVLSVETHVADPDVGFVKLEDTVIVTEHGAEAVGDHGRGWNVIPG